MFLIIFAALIAAGETAKLDRTYLPPISAATAGGSPASLQLPFTRSNEGSQGKQDIPTGGFVNDHQGIVVEAALAGTRASGPQSGLGGPRISYGSSDSKVGGAAFKVTSNKYPQGPVSGILPNGEPDLSAFHQRPSSRPGNTQIIGNYVSNTVKYQNEVGLNKFNYAFETDNGIKISENAIAKNGIQAEGGYSYTGDDGKVYSVVYTADKNGYRASGSHLPTPHPIPQAILEALEQNARDEAAGLIDDGSYDPKKYNTEYDYAENYANDQYNDRQSNKFGDRPVFAGGFINQNQQAFVTPSFNGQFGLNDASKDAAFSKPDSSKFGSLVQNNNRFGSLREPSPQNANSFQNKQQVPNQFPGLSGATHPNIQAKPLSQQKLQEQKPFEKLPFNRPSSYDTSNLGIQSSSVSTSQPSSVGSFGLSNQGVAINVGNRINRPSGEAFQNKPTQGFFGSTVSSQGQPNVISGSNKPFSPQYSLSTITSNQPSTGYFTSQPIQQFPSTNVQSSQNGRLPGSQFSSSPLNDSLTTLLKPTFPTKQPQTTLTTPLESFGATNAGEPFTQTDINKKEDKEDASKTTAMSQEFTTSLSQSTPNIPGDSIISFTGTDMSTSFNSLDNRFSDAQTTQSIGNTPQIVQSISSIKQPSDAEFSSNTQKPTYDFTQFTQPQGPDHSYIYNRPNKPFNTPLTGAGSISSSGANSQVTPILSPQSFKPSFNAPSTSAFSQFGPTSITVSAQASAFPNSQTVSNQGVQTQSQFVQGASFNTPSEYSQTGQDTSVIPTEEPMTQNSQSGLVDKQTTTSQVQGSLQSSFPPLIKPFSFNSQKPVIQFGQQSSSSSRRPATNPAPPFTSQLPTLTSKFDNKPASQLGNFNTQNRLSEIGGFTSKRPFSPTFPFSSQESTLHNEGVKGNEQTTTFGGGQQTGDPFDEKYSTSLPSSIQPQTGSFDTQRPSTQFGQSSFSITSLKPSSQSHFGSQVGISSFEQESYNVKETTPSQFDQSTQQFGTQFGPLPSSTQPQTDSFDAQRPSTPFGQSSFSITSLKPSSQSHFGQEGITSFGQGSFNNKETTPSHLDQSTQQFGTQFENKQSTQMPLSSQTQFNNYNTQTTNAQFNTPTTSNFDQFVSTNQPSQLNTQLSGQPGQEKTTTSSQFDTKQQTTTFNEPSSLISSTSETQTPTQNSEFSQIYDYTKPAQGLLTPSRKQDEPQFQSNKQFDKQDLLTTQKQIPAQFTQPSFNFATSQFSNTNKDETESDTQQNISTGFPSTQDSISSTSQNTDQSTGEIYEYNKPSTQFDQQGFLNVQKEKPSQFTKPSFSFGNSQFTTNEDKTESVTQENIKMFPSTQNDFTSTSQTGGQNIGEIYEYNKPSTQFGQLDSSNFQKDKPAQFTQSSFNLESPQFSTNRDKTESVTQENILTGFPSTQEAFTSTSQSGGQSTKEVYEYNKPSTQFGHQGLLSVQKEIPAQFPQSSFNFASSQLTTNEDKTESATQQNIVTSFQSTQEAFSSTSQSGDQTTAEINEYNKPSSQFGQQSALNVQNEKPAQFPQPSFNLPSSQFTTNEDKTESITQENILTGFPSTQDAFSSTSQNGGQGTGEIYEYNKPEQTLSTSSETDGTTLFGQKIQSILNINKENIFTNQQTTPQFGQTTLNIQNTQNTEDLTSTVSLQTTEKPRPQFAFHSACCGSIFKKPLVSNNLNPSVNAFNQNKESVSDQKEGQVGQSIDQQILEPEKASSFKGVGEKFPSSRKPASFDVNGYHY